MRPPPAILILPHDGARPTAAATAVVACGRVLASLTPVSLEGLVPDADPQAPASACARRFGLPVTALEVPGGTDICDPDVIRELASRLAARRPAWVLCNDDPVGRHLAAGVAASLSAACVAGVAEVGPGDDGIVLTRSVYGGKYRVRIRPRTPAVVLTVDPGAFAGAAFAPGAETAGKTPPRRESIAVGNARRRVLAVHPRPEQDPGLAEARVVVAAGSGIGDADSLEVVRRLAARLPGAAVAGSRPVCDRGWLPVNRQVGITGSRVAPALYIACGISGAAQHLAGMSGAGLVVAINRDPRAAIFNHADVGVVEDLATFLPLFLDTLDAGEPPMPST